VQRDEKMREDAEWCVEAQGTGVRNDSSSSPGQNYLKWSDRNEEVGKLKYRGRESGNMRGKAQSMKLGVLKHIMCIVLCQYIYNGLIIRFIEDSSKIKLGNWNTVEVH
jgi:hypothetical protein